MTAPIHKGQIIVVTGASQGIGAEISLMLGRLGAKVVMLARNLDNLNAIVTQIGNSESGGSGHPYQVDLTKRDEMVKTITKIIQEEGVPDVLINNAGAGTWKTILETPIDDLIQNITVPGISTMAVTKLFLEDMIKKGTSQKPVHIINITSPAGFEVYVPGTSGGYSVARKMVTNFTQSLRVDLRDLQDKVKISLIAPGKVATEYFQTNGNGEQEDRVPLRKWIPELKPAEVAKKVSQVIINRKSVDVTFPFMVTALAKASKFSPAIMQFFLTHVFGWQPPRARAAGASKTSFFSGVVSGVAIGYIVTFFVKRYALGIFKEHKWINT